jgi:hypothetical protein
MAELSIKQILESESYKHQKDIVKRAINKNVTPLKIDNGLFAPARLADLRRVLSVDYNTFKKTDSEKAELSTLKDSYIKKMKKSFPDWTQKTSGKIKFLQFHTKSIW